MKVYEGKESENSIITNGLNEKRIIIAIETQAQASGMSISEEPDAYLIYGVGIDNIRECSGVPKVPFSLSS